MAYPSLVSVFGLLLPRRATKTDEHRGPAVLGKRSCADEAQEGGETQAAANNVMLVTLKGGDILMLRC